MLQRLNTELKEKLNKRICEELTTDKEIELLVPEREETQVARMIWKEMRGIILELAKDCRFGQRLIASIDFGKSGKLLAVFYQDNSNMYKSFVLGVNPDRYKVLLILAWIMSEYGMELTPTKRFSNHSEYDWSIEFTRH